MDYRRRQEQAHAARRAAQRAVQTAVAQGRVVALDQLGRPLAPGDLVHLDVPQARVFQILDVTPLLDPTVPPGSVRVIAQAQLTAVVPSGRPWDGCCQVQLHETLPTPGTLDAAAGAGTADDAAGTDARVAPADDVPAGPRLHLTDRD